MKASGAPENLVQQTENLLQQCEAALYFGALPMASFTDIKAAAEKLIRDLGA